MEKVKLPTMSYFPFPTMFSMQSCILKSFNSHNSVVFCSFFEFGTVSKWCIREWVKPLPGGNSLTLFNLKAFADDKSNVTQTKFSVFHWVENMEPWKRRKRWLPAFSPFFYNLHSFFRLKSRHKTIR